MLRHAFFSLTCALCAFAQLSPEDSLAKIKVADGLEITLFAAEPDVWNPTTIDIDAQGRVWVCEARNYRLFNQPITEKAGDRIRILEDTDGDGRCDKATTFYQHETLQAPMGIAVLGDRVYICQAPDLFYLEDVDKDGVADKRTVILTGFEGADHDHTVHGVSFGPDGMLYFSVGDRGLDVADKSGNRVQVGKDRPHQAATVLRCDLEGDHLELLAEGMRNPYEPAVDPWGNVFVSDNDDDGNEQCRINYVMEGGNYGYWPRRKGDRKLDAVHWNADQPGVVPAMVKTGMGSPTGLMFYQGTLLPAQFQNALIHTDAGPRVVRSYRPEPLGAGYSSKIDVLVSCDEDPWFRPSDVCAAPDGSLYISDWYDPGVGGHRMGDVSRGRIYRLAPMGNKSEVPVLDLESPEGLLNALNSPNQARRYLAYAHAPKAQRLNWEVTAALQAMQKKKNSADAARAYWVLMRGEHNGVSEGALLPNGSNLASVIVRRLAREGMPMLKMAFQEDIINNPDARVRAQLLLELRRYNTEPWAKPVIIQLVTQYDGNDRFYREAIGIALRGIESWAYNEITAQLGGTWDERMAGLVIQLHPPDALPFVLSALGDSKLEPDLRIAALDALDAIGSTEAGQHVVKVLTADAPEELKSHALHLLARDEGDRWRNVLEKSAIATYLDAVIGNPEQLNGALAFVAETRFTPAISIIVTRAADAGASTEDRVAALNTLQTLASRA